MVFGGLSVEEAIRLYYEKQDAIKRGDMSILREIKKQSPSLFDPAAVNDIEILLDYVAKLRKMPDFQDRYATYCKNKKTVSHVFTFIQCDEEKPS